MRNSANIRSISGYFEKKFPILVWFLDYFVSYCYKTKNEYILHCRLAPFHSWVQNLAKTARKNDFEKVSSLFKFWKFKKILINTLRNMIKRTTLSTGSGEVVNRLASVRVVLMDRSRCWEPQAILQLQKIHLWVLLQVPPQYTYNT